MSRKQWNVEMNYFKLTLIMLLISIPLLVILMHSILELKYLEVIEYDFFGIDISLSFVYNVVLCLSIFSSMICILLFLVGKFKVQQDEELE